VLLILKPKYYIPKALTKLWRCPTWGGGWSRWFFEGPLWFCEKQAWTWQFLNFYYS